MSAPHSSNQISAANFFPAVLTWRRLREAAANCRGCELYRNATQTVFGEGPSHARLVLVGECPGDQEDLDGRPFVGAAGRLLDEALADIQMDRQEIYITNSVKHFKWTPRGRRRLHSKPNSREIRACRPWLDAEIKLLKPELIVCLGATAAQNLLGSNFRITQQRGQLIETPGTGKVLATYHPAAVLRAPEQSRQLMRSQFTSDLRAAANFLANSGRA